MELDAERVNRSLIHGEAFANELIHIESALRKRKYDPVKRKEYYERTKKLKGRKKGKSKWTKDLQYSTEKGIKKLQARSKDPKERMLRLEKALSDISKARRDLKRRGMAGSRDDVELENAQHRIIAEAFKVKGPYNGGGRLTTDRYGNLITLPPGVSVKEFSDFKWTAENDWVPNVRVQNPIKKLDVKKLDVDLQNPFKKGPKEGYQRGPQGNGQADKAPKDYKQSKNMEGHLRDVAKSIRRPRKMPWDKEFDQVEDKRKSRKKK